MLPDVGDIPLEALRRPDLLALLEAQATAGKSRTANVLLADLKQMLDFAVERELIVMNPLAPTEKAGLGGADVERERVLAEDRVRQLVAALPAAHMNPDAIAQFG